MDVRRTPGQRAGLTREAVLEASGELLAERGLDGLTMRALATKLGVSPNSLYSHVASKTGLVDELLDETLALVEAPDPNATDPVAGLRAVMESTYEVLLSHSALVPVYLARQGSRGPHAQDLGDVMLALLRRAGVQGTAAREALRVLIVYTLGFAAFAVRPQTDLAEERPLSDEQLADNFQRGLRWLLAGIVDVAQEQC